VHAVGGWRRARQSRHPGVKHAIRLEAVVWGGVRSKEGISSLDSPRFVAASQASYLTPEELVFGVNINGDTLTIPQ